MENSAENSEKSCNFRRFDDLVRSERYFTATLLPLLLFHNNLEGVQRFVECVDNNAKTERNSFGELMLEKGTPEYNNYKDVEVITEFHTARDLKFAGPLGEGASAEPSREVRDVGPSEEGEPKKAALMS
jgi:hypothetical protein